MNIANIFSTEIGYLKDKQLTDSLIPLAEKYLKDENGFLTYAWGYKNTYGSSCLFNDLDPAKELILSFARSYLDKTGYNVPKNLDVQIFFSSMTRGDFHDAHTHPGCILSGIFYLKVPANSSNIEFIDPRLQPIFSQLVSKQENNHLFNVPVEDGLGLIWHSWLSHQVPPTDNEGERVTMVFNIFIKNYGLSSSTK